MEQPIHVLYKQRYVQKRELDKCVFRTIQVLAGSPNR